VNIDIEILQSSLRRVIVTFDDVDVKKARDRAARTVGQQVSIPGFRKGKVPLSILERRYTDELREGTRYALTDEASDEVKKRILQKIVGIDRREWSDRDYTLTLWVEVLPDFVLPNYRSLRFVPFVDDVDDSEIDTAVDQLRRQEASYNLVDRAAELGDYVKISYHGTVDDVPIESLPNIPKIWGSQKMIWEEAGNSREGVVAVVNGIVGLSAGQTKSVEMIFPDNFPIPPLAGQKAVYEVEVHEVHEAHLPELDGDFLKTHQVETVEALRSSIAEQLHRQKMHEYRHHQEMRIVDFFVKNVECDLPKSWVQLEMEGVLQSIVNALAERGLREEALEAHRAALVGRARTLAEERLKLQVCLEKVAEMENVNVEEVDIQEVLIQECSRRGISMEQLLHILKENKEDREWIRNAAFRAKLLRHMYTTILSAGN
jgi:trigger factor